MYPWLLAEGHPAVKKRRRPPIPAAKRHRDRRNDYKRKSKHPGKDEEAQ